VSGSQEVHHKREWQKGCCGEEEEEKEPDRDRDRVYKGVAAKQERERTGLNQIKSNKTSPKSVCANSSTQGKKKSQKRLHSIHKHPNNNSNYITFINIPKNQEQQEQQHPP
jgi:hypothetical protein